MSNKISISRRFAIVDEWVINLDISDRAFKLYAILARYADNDTHKAFPSRDTLAERLRCSKASVDRAVLELVDAKAIQKRHRAYNSVLYTVLIDPPEGVLTGDNTMSSPVITDVLTGDDVTRTTELELLNDIFDDFWQTYPKKADKALARRSFEKALKRATAERILDGARQYRDDPGRDDAYTKNPSTWLNADAWENEYVKPKETPGPGKREWVREMHELGEHWACEPGEFAEGCDQ
jgi:predicted transcriptional regulator